MFDYLFNIVAFDNDPDIGSDPEPSPNPENKTFTQEEVNSLMAKQKRDLRAAQEKLMSQLEESKKVSKVGSERRTELEKQIEELQKQTMTAEERAKQKENKLQKQHQEELTQTKGEVDRWKNLYTSSTISNSLLKSAGENKAKSPIQILKMFQHDVKLVPVLDENGQATDNYEARMDFADTDDEGKDVTLNLTVPEAIKRMTELPQYGNLFEGNKNGGLDANNIKDKKGRIDIAKIAATDPAKYRELRKKNPELFKTL